MRRAARASGSAAVVKCPRAALLGTRSRRGGRNRAAEAQQRSTARPRAALRRCALPRFTPLTEGL